MVPTLRVRAPVICLSSANRISIRSFGQSALSCHVVLVWPARCPRVVGRCWPWRKIYIESGNLNSEGTHFEQTALIHQHSHADSNDTTARWQFSNPFQQEVRKFKRNNSWTEFGNVLCSYRGLKMIGGIESQTYKHHAADTPAAHPYLGNHA